MNRQTREERRIRRWLIAAPPTTTVVAESTREDAEQVAEVLRGASGVEVVRLIELKGKLQADKVEAWAQWKNDLEEEYTWTELAQVLDVQVEDLEKGTLST